MDKNLNQIKNKKIFFIGRLEEEKWVKILLEIIQNSISSQKPIEYHIFWDGSYFSYFSYFDKNFVKIYWKLDRKELFAKIQNEADFVLMPSEFLETFGLSALESLQLWVPVIGFRKWWLIDFIPQELSLNSSNPVKSFFDILEKNFFPKIDISRFDYSVWVHDLTNLTQNYQKILLVHDYKAKIGWAEIYVNNLKNELEKIWKKVEIFAYEWEINSKIRKKLFLKSIFSLENYQKLSQKIEDFAPDLIWSHTILRFIGFSGMKAIKNSEIPHFITHHDIGLFASEPSKIHNFEDIPKSPRFGSWLNKAKNIFGIVKILIKWIIVTRIWAQIPQNTIHIFPSKWMIEMWKNYNLEKIEIFEHTVFRE